MIKVKIETPRRLKDDPEALRRWQQSAPVAMATALGTEIRKRVEERGEPTKRHTPAELRGFQVSPRYPGAGAGVLLRSGARLFGLKSEFRRAINDKPDHFAPSGGMWDGLSTVGRGARAAETLFRGRSEGQDPAVFTYKSGKTKARGRSISNALKAWTVLEKTGVNLLELTDAEFAALGQAMTDAAGVATSAALGMGVAMSSQSSSSPVYATLRALMAR